MLDLVNALKRFTYPSYIQLIEHLLNKYDLITAQEYNPKTDRSTVVVRHDVDWDLESATHIARIENNLGVRSTYFVLLSCPTYNLFSEYGMDKIREILSLGHEIGLHYDISVYNHDTELTYDKLLEMEINSLERITRGQKISCISCHNTSKLDHDPLRNIWLNNLSDIAKFDNYVTDANRQWHPPYLLPLINGEHKKNQLLTHPCLWSTDQEYVIDRYERIHRCISKIEDSWVKLWREKDEKLKQTNR